MSGPFIPDRRTAWRLAVVGWVIGTVLLYDEWARQRRAR